MPDTTGALQRARFRADLDHERTRAETRTELLPFGDGYLDDDRPDFHGTNVGLQRHADAQQPPCPPCAELLNELLVAGLVRPRTDHEPEEITATGRGIGRARHRRAESVPSFGRSSGLHASPPAPFTRADPAGVAHQEQGRAT